MNKKYWLKIIIYGLIQWVIFLLILFVVSMVLGVNDGAEMSAPPPIGFVLVAVIMAGITYLLLRRLKPTSQRQAIYAGVLWSGMTITFMLVTTIANDTQSLIFGNWGVYLVLVCQAIGSMLVKIPTPNLPKI